MPPTATSYDDIPYLTKPRAQAHADALATLATLAGMSPAPVDRCRVLELGCGTGGHRLAMAASLPGSEFVGVDLSGVQIDAARRAAAAAGLTNVAFAARGIPDLGPADGPFDYVVCHGVYSWVPESVRDAILRVCADVLAPHGVAYVSYNTYPGWHLRQPVRDMLKFHAGRAPTVADRVPAARGMLAFLTQHAPDPDGTYGRLLREEAEVLADAPDHYLFHEHLEDDNQPVYFMQFAAHAAAHGLQYLGESGPVRRTEGLSPEARAALAAVAPDLVTMEQYLDFLYNRQFRKTLLCRADVELNRAPPAAILDGLLAVAAGRPEPGAGVTGPETMTFRGADGTAMTSNAPPAKAAMAALSAAWPRALPVPELRRAAADLLTREGGGEWGPVAERLFVQFVLSGYLSGLVMLHTHRPAFAADPPGPAARPRAFAFARSQAESQADVSTALHFNVQVSDAERFVLRSLDGSRDRAALLAALAGAAGRGEFAAPASPEAWLDDLLTRMARSGLLEA
jgi:methyltransferase-like protein/cyclopropane fatty-acyl-phospholipid synthase-like methyltransferase